jgi:isoleucyl-tRNA synthetase
MSKKNHAAEEKDVLDYWDEHSVFQKSIDQRPESDPYVFYDGPPFATGTPHYGHIVGSVMKDVIPRYFTMRGKRVERKWGWDCHGLPIEAIVEKEHGLKTKEDIEAMGVAEFNGACDSKVMLYAGEWQKVIRRLGRWVDMENDYKTKDIDYMESVWWVFKQLFEKDRIYEGYKSMHVSPALETVVSNFEVNMGGYKEMTDLSVSAKFVVTSGEHTGAYMVAWTTTPWTLPGNVLLAVNKSLVYSLVSWEGTVYVVASDLVETVFADKEGYKIAGNVNGADLVGSTYEPLFPYYKDHPNAFRVVHGDFVTTEEGTGVVHIAPGFGEDDLNLGREEKVAPIVHVELNGRFVTEVERALVEEGYDVEGWAVKNKEDSMHVDVEMVKWLAHHDKLFAKKKIRHQYPVCWRTDVPLINYATTSWFVKVEDIQEKLVKTNQEINWTPNHIKEGRFGNWLAEARDWAISRSRYWGTPLPIWRSDDGEVLCVGSKAELAELSGIVVEDLHKHIVDEIEFAKDGKTFRRIPEVLDCWFESGSMPYAQMHYPFKNERKFDAGFPAEFIAEGQDQTRGWFYTLHVLANSLFDMPAYKNVIVNGIVLAEDGKKMSKRLQNYPDPMEVMEKYGSDAIRYYLMSSPVVRAENLRFSERDVAEVSKKFIAIMKNVLSFYELYREHDDGRTAQPEHVLDLWIVSRMNQTLEEETDALDHYDLQRAARVLQVFVTDLSTWYVRRSRDRLKEEGEDQKQALATLRFVLETFSKMVAPFMPFLGEMLYQSIAGGFAGEGDRLSVHLENWPQAGEVNEDVLAKMGEARAIVSRVLDAREESGRAVKQVLGSVIISVPSGEIEQGCLETVLAEVNVKAAEVKKGEMQIELDTQLTPELIREGMVREVTRKVNGLRKESGLTIEDRINLQIWSADTEVEKMVDEFGDALELGTLAALVEFKQGDAKHSVEFRVMEKDIWIGF